MAPSYNFKEVPRISVLSTTFVKCTVSATESGVAANPTSGQIYFAFTDNTSPPASGDWVAGTWESADDVYWALCLIGPDDGAIVLPAGEYDVYVRLTKGLETVVNQVGILAVY